MILTTVLFVLSSWAMATTTCDALYEARENGLGASQAAYQCLEENLTTLNSKEDKAIALNRMSYLKFFMAEYFMDEKEKFLLEGINLAEKSILLFGTKYSVTEYMALSPSERKALSEALYNYGLTTARYIDIKGQWEAIKRMEDIKRSMNTILRIKEEKTAVYGAHRTLGIFHMKVPYIAGGRIELSKQYLTTTLENTKYSGDLSLYPANNIAYADLMYKLGKNDESCHHLKIVADLTESEVRNMNNGLYFETLQSILEAKKLISLRKCLK